MADQAVIDLVRRYLDVLNEHGICAEKTILFGSHARGNAHEYSDIDILVLSEEFDKDRWARDDELWKLTTRAGYGLQPIPVGVKQYIEDDLSAVIEIARREGIEITRN